MYRLTTTSMHEMSTCTSPLPFAPPMRVNLSKAGVVFAVAVSRCGIFSSLVSKSVKVPSADLLTLVAKSAGEASSWPETGFADLYQSGEK